jgi:PIN domain nuclease of toxin-antitoxin system
VKLLLDSNVVLRMLMARRRLTPRALRLLEDDRNQLFFSFASLWEVAIKVAVGKLDLPAGSAESLLPELHKLGVTLLPIDQASILRTQTLPHFTNHKDPFDRLLVAQALEFGLTILSSDRDLALYAAPVIWRY